MNKLLVLNALILASASAAALLTTSLSADFCYDPSTVKAISSNATVIDYYNYVVVG